MSDASDSNAEELELNLIATTWGVVSRAHADGDEAATARRELLERYSPAVRRYLLASVHDQHAADDLFQEFALRFVRGDFKRADPARGRFRDFLKTCLYHLIVDHARRKKRDPGPLSAEAPEPADDAPAADPEFRAIWLAELMNRAWGALAAEEREDGRPLYTVLRSRADHPQLRSAQLAEQLSERLGKSVTADWVRKQLSKGRERFTDLLLEETARSLGSPTADELIQELVDLEILDYCRAALGRREGSGK